MPNIDLFTFFRTVVFIFAGAYALAMTAAGAWQIWTLLHGREPHQRLLHRYVSYQVATVRIGPLAGELVQIGLWSAVLGFIWWMHTRI